MRRSKEISDVSIHPAGSLGFCGASDLEVDAARFAALGTVEVSDIQHLPADSIVKVQAILLNGEKLGFWATPQHWLVASFKRRAINGAEIDLRRRIVDCLPEELRRRVTAGEPSLGDAQKLAQILDLAVLVLSRYLLLLRVGPVGMKRGSLRPLDVSTVLRLAYANLPPLFAVAVRSRFENVASESDASFIDPNVAEPLLLETLEFDDMAGMSDAARRAALGECRRMERLHAMGLWGDVPQLRVQAKSKAMTGERQFNPAPLEIDSHLPLPDEYVAQMGSRSLWLINDLYPNLKKIGESIAHLWNESGSSGMAPDSIRNLRYKGVQSILKTYRWIDRNGEAFEAPPFQLILPKAANNMPVHKRNPSTPDEEASVWPPRGTRDIVALLGVVQMAHYFVLAMSMGARQSETLDLTRNALRLDVDGRPVLRGHDGALVRGRTFKLEDDVAGRVRDWHLPDVAVHAYKQQVELVTLIEKIGRMLPRENRLTVATTGPTHLWAQAAAGGKSDTSKPLLDINRALATFARALDMDGAPAGQNLRSHRFRKTLARLVALALTQAPSILMGLFGHKNIEMTLFYILSDKELRAEIEVVERELRVMRAKEAIHLMVEADIAGSAEQSSLLGGYGGLAALKVRTAIETSRRDSFRRGQDFGADSIAELAELLTFQGQAWEQVRHGVVCTKVPGQAGPCNKGTGRPEPSRCQSSCDHRLEEAFLRADVDGAIHDAVAAYVSESEKGEVLSAAFWAGQIRAHIPRFQDLRDKWMSDSVVNSLMNGAPSGGFHEGG